DFSPDGKLLALSFSYTEQMELADAASGTPVRHFTSGTVGLWPFKFTADGSKIFVTGWRGANGIWDVNTGEAIGTWARSAGTELMLSPDGKTMASIESRKILLMKADTGEPVVPDEGASTEVDHIELHPDGRRLLTGANDGRTGFTIWDRDTG